ncbi:hypothetical protein DID88_007349 [Monilinia fructigena]|uniref:Uncharacterized protein n=1 Tax=Monilinia fructigena TaxID=38457 RepID=A0A395J829_9HELO|nr:hypothetical protein DID88_007349 [Monilinia fructigena]
MPDMKSSHFEHILVLILIHQLVCIYLFSNTLIKVAIHNRRKGRKISFIRSSIHLIHLHFASPSMHFLESMIKCIPQDKKQFPITPSTRYHSALTVKDGDGKIGRNYEKVVDGRMDEIYERMKRKHEQMKLIGSCPGSRKTFFALNERKQK